jgi:chromate transporter
MMENEIVRRRRWVSHERFLDMLGAVNLIPGPSSSELAIFLGYERAGVVGLLLAGLCFVLPAALLTGGIGWAYVHFGAVPQVDGLLYGIKPVVIAIVVKAICGLAPKAIKRSKWLATLAAIGCFAAACRVDPLAVLLGLGMCSALRHSALEGRGNTRDTNLLALPSATATAAAASTASIGPGALFVTFVKMGAMVFGSGYVLLAFLRADLVQRLHWLTERELLDAVAVGQVTPGPVFTTATFIGYLLAGPSGAALATLGIFLPGFVLVALIRPLVGSVRRSRWAGAFLDGVNVAAVALMAVVTVDLARAALVDGLTFGLALISGVLLFRFRLNSACLLVGGGIVGAIVGRHS